MAFFTSIYFLQFHNPCCACSSMGIMCRPAKFRKSQVIKGCRYGFFSKSPIHEQIASRLGFFLKRKQTKKTRMSPSLSFCFCETTLYVIAGLWANVTNYPVATGDWKTWWWWWEENKHIAHVSSIRRVYVNEISMIYWKTDFRKKLLKNRLRWSYIAEANNGSGTGPLEIWLRISNWPG